MTTHIIMTTHRPDNPKTPGRVVTDLLGGFYPDQMVATLTGSWDGVEEPSVAIRTRTLGADLEYAVRLLQAHNQDAALILSTEDNVAGLGRAVIYPATGLGDHTRGEIPGNDETTFRAWKVGPAPADTGRTIYYAGLLLKNGEVVGL